MLYSGFRRLIPACICGLELKVSGFCCKFFRIWGRGLPATTGSTKSFASSAEEDISHRLTTATGTSGTDVHQPRAQRRTHKAGSHSSMALK